MKNPGLFLSFLLSLCWTVSAAAAGPVEITQVTIHASPGQTQLVLDLSGPVRHELFDLTDPARVVVDLKKSKLSASQLPDGTGFVKRIRSGKPDKSTVRVVLDLAKKVRMRSYQRTPEEGNHHQLVVELYTDVAANTAVKSAANTTHGRDVIVAIDAGHGGIDPGASGRGGTREKDVVLAIAKKLKKHIDAQPGFKGTLIRDDDTFLMHRNRMKLAREARADLFVSIHADAFTNAQAHGSTVYVLSERGASSEAAHWLAQRENAADLLGGVTLDDKDDMLASVLLDLSQTASLSASIEAGNHVAKQLGKVGRVRRKHVQHAGFLVLTSPDIPSILVETAFISNPKEEKRLRSKKHQQAWAEAIGDGIMQFFSENPPVGTLVAKQQKHQRPTAIDYTISRGDTLSDIADRFNVRLRKLRALNNIRGDQIRVGQVIRIPAGSAG